MHGRLRRPSLHRPEDFFGNPIHVLDRYFYGHPPVVGQVIKVRRTSILLETGADSQGRSTTMNCRSPERGICLDKVPNL